MKLEKVSHVHCIGIGGIGVSAVARLFLAQGKTVSGSDIRESSVTEELKALGVRIMIGHSAENVGPNTELVVHTEDVNETSPGYVEIGQGKKIGAEVLSYAKVVGLIMQGMKGIGVSGTNGKSTTTAMLGLIAEKAGADPTVIVGSKIPKLPGSSFRSNTRVGESNIFIVEADEYHRHMLDAKPWGVIITNINADHLDYYKDLGEIQEAFNEYVNALPDDGVLIYNSDDAPSQNMAETARVSKLSFGFGEKADVRALNVRTEGRKQSFELIYKGKNLGEFSLVVPGQHNLANALAAAAMALALGISPEHIKTSLAEFPGIWRRFETVGEVEGKILISDYAHHPDGILRTLEAVRQFYPDSKVLTVFQPHQKNRTSKLYKEFLESLKPCDGLILTEIFSVVGREKTNINITSKTLAEDLKPHVKEVFFAEDLRETEKLIREEAKNYQIILFMGAGDIDTLARKLAQ